MLFVLLVMILLFSVALRTGFTIVVPSLAVWWLFSFAPVAHLFPPPLPPECNSAVRGGAEDAEIKVPSDESTERKRSPSKAWSKSIYSHTCYAYCQGFLPCFIIPFRAIHLHFFQNLPRFLLCWLWLTHGSWVGPQNKIAHLAGCRFPC